MERKILLSVLFVTLMSNVFFVQEVASIISDSTKQISRQEINTFSCAGYLSDYSGSGWFVYGELSYKIVKNNHLTGAFFGTSYSDCLFNDYQYYGNEIVFGVTYARWGNLTENVTFAFSASPCFKHFSDYGYAIITDEKIWQRDWGNQITLWFNLSDKKNRPLRNLKMHSVFQTAFWSKREGTGESDFVTDDLNYKAVNRTFFKIQFESTVKKIPVKQFGRIEPKLVTGYLRDWSTKNNMYEFGFGLGLSFNKDARYYEIMNLQYRARYGDDFKGLSDSRRLDFFEIGIDPKRDRKSVV